MSSSINMARPVASLTDTKCNNAKAKEKDYKLFDGEGLFLLVKTNNKKIWKIKYYKPDGKESLMSLGNYPTVSLKQARESRQEIKELLSQHIDPAIFKQQQKTKNQDKALTFEPLVRNWLIEEAKAKQWSAVHIKKMTRIVENYILPRLGKRPVHNINFQELLAVIQAVKDKGYLDVTKTVRQILRSTMSLALFKNIITSNPAADLDQFKVNAKKIHRPALPIERIGELTTAIYNYPNHLVTRYALIISLHLFVRSSELRFATWQEINFQEKIWTIPPHRQPIQNARGSERGTKMKDIHLIPLSQQVITLLTEIKQITGDYDLIFTYDGIKPLSENCINQALRKLGYDTKTEVCGHGFRTLACSALNESGKFTEDSIERQMSHQERNNVRAAYTNKAKHLEERMEMMQWWSNYIEHVRTKGFIAPYKF